MGHKTIKRIIFSFILLFCLSANAEKVYIINKTMSGGGPNGYYIVKQGAWETNQTHEYEVSIVCDGADVNPCVISGDWPITNRIPEDILDAVDLNFRGFINEKDSHFAHGVFSNEDKVISVTDILGNQHRYLFRSFAEPDGSITYELHVI